MRFGTKTLVKQKYYMLSLADMSKRTKLSIQQIQYRLKRHEISLSRPCLPPKSSKLDDIMNKHDHFLSQRSM